MILSELLSNSCRYARPLAPLLDLAGGAPDEFPLHPTDLAKPQERAESRPGRPTAEAAAVASAGSAEVEEAATLDELLVGAGVHRHPAAAHEAAGTPCPEQPGGVLVRWQMHTDGLLSLEVTDGGASTRPLPASPSLTAKGGRGLSIVGQLAVDWGVRDAPGEVTVWAVLPAWPARPARRSA
ncbi:ATP-binding protein [Kitasatospora sp. NBC_01287]|uniref:ATP-binding protein n=1 Tax=Kitasatospora sp. NBC_01287 TaxID=2903573 RepID=UPI00224DFC06|nr:ATP-binding protein [Kitasatospora sp. NBC_01287]MCX4747911.1 ATP-binding protein [Kitasatospora sp. NBC_01287]